MNVDVELKSVMDCEQHLPGTKANIYKKGYVTML